MAEEKIIKDRENLARIIEAMKQQGKRIVLTNGGFQPAARGTRQKPRRRQAAR